MIWVTRMVSMRKRERGHLPKRRIMGSRPSARAAAAAILALGSWVALAGCGGTRGERAGAERLAVGNSGGAAAMIVRAAARRTLAAPAGVEFQLDGATALGSSRAPVLGSGEFDFPSGVGSETIDLGEVGRQEPGTEHVILLASHVYLQPKAPATRVLPSGKQWVTANLAGSDSVSTNFPSFALQLESVNPQLLLDELATGAMSATRAGGELVEGEYARAYEVRVDLARSLGASRGPLAAVFGQAIRSELAAAESEAASTGQSTAIRVWVDRGGRVVRLRSTPPGAGVGTATMTMCCFGLPVAVGAPPPSSVVDLASLTPSGERENNGGGDSDGG